MVDVPDDRFRPVVVLAEEDPNAVDADDPPPSPRRP